MQTMKMTIPPIFNWEICWGSFQWFRECVVKSVLMVYWKWIERKCKQISVTDKLWKCACKIGTSKIKNSDCERLLGIDIDSKLSFENHIKQICSKARVKIKALARIAPFLNKKRKLWWMNFSDLSLVIAHYHGCLRAEY